MEAGWRERWRECCMPCACIGVARWRMRSWPMPSPTPCWRFTRWRRTTLLSGPELVATAKGNALWCAKRCASLGTRLPAGDGRRAPGGTASARDAPACGLKVADREGSAFQQRHQFPLHHLRRRELSPSVYHQDFLMVGQLDRPVVVVLFLHGCILLGWA